MDHMNRHINNFLECLEPISQCLFRELKEICVETSAHLCVLLVINPVLHLLSDILVIITVAEFFEQFRVGLCSHWILCLIIFWPLEFFAPIVK